MSTTVCMSPPHMNAMLSASYTQSSLFEKQKKIEQDFSSKKKNKKTNKIELIYKIKLKC